MNSALTDRQSRRAVICSSGAPALEVFAERLRAEGFEVLLALPKGVGPAKAQSAEWCLYMDCQRPEAAGLIARFAADAELLVDGWGLPDDLPSPDRTIEVQCFGAAANDPEVGAGSILLAWAGMGDRVDIGAPDRIADHKCTNQSLATGLELKRLGVDESQIVALSAERII